MQSRASRGLAGVASLALLVAAGCAQPAVAPAATNPATQPTQVATVQSLPTETSTVTPAPTSATTAEPTAVVPVPTAAPTGTRAPEPAGTAVISYKQVRTGGLVFEVPASWPITGDQGVYRDPDTGVTVGVNVVPWSPGMEPTSVLPNHSLVTGRTELKLPWGTGEEYRLERSSPAAQGGVITGHETHVLVRMGNKSIVDVFSAVPVGVDASVADEVRQHLLQSVTLLGG